MRLVLTTTLAAVLTLGCAQAPAPVTSGPDVDAINTLRERELVAFTTADRDELGSVYTDDVHVMPPNTPSLHGLDAVAEFARGMTEAFTVTGEYTGAQVTVVGDRAYETYTVSLTLTPTGGGEPMVDVSKGMHVYERQADGSWRIAIDTWNSDSPPHPLS